jgi:hypothetical protein
MGHGPAETIEHAQHAQHAAHDNFDRTVTISIAILAAGLACVTILSHQTHNAMLSKQIEAGIDSNKGTNRWGQFQAYNIRSHTYKMFVDFADTESAPPTKERKELLAKWQKQVDKYEKGKMPETQKLAEGFDTDAERKMAESHHIHHKTERIDLGDLGLQLGVVLASLAILTKKRSFWVAGVACGAAGFIWAMTGYFEIGLPHQPHGTHATSSEPGSSQGGHESSNKSDSHEKQKGH